MNDPVDQLLEFVLRQKPLLLLFLFMLFNGLVTRLGRWLKGAADKAQAASASATSASGDAETPIEASTGRVSPGELLRRLAAAAAAERARRQAPAGAPAGPPMGPGEEEVTLSGLDKRTSELSRRMRHDRRFRRLRPLFVEAVESPVTALIAEAVTDRGSGEGSDRAQLRLLFRRLQRYELLAQQRVQAESSDRILALEAVANEALAPLSDFARAEGPGLPADVVTVLFTDRPRPLAASSPDDPHLLLLPLPPTAGLSLLDYDALLHLLGERLLLDVRGLAPQVYETLELTPAPAMPRDHYDAVSAQALFGAMVPAFFGEVFASLRGGPGHGKALLSRLKGSRQPARVLPQGAGYHPAMPALMQMRVCTQVLRHQDFDADQKALWRAFCDHHGAALDAVALPTSSGVQVVGPTEFFLELCDRFTEQLLSEPLVALDDYRLTEIPGLCHLQLAADHRRAQTARVLSGQAPQGDPLTMTLATCAALGQGPSEAELVALLRLSLLGRQASPQPSRRVRTAPLTLSASLRSPAALREAMALDAALGRRAHGRDRV